MKLRGVPSSCYVAYAGLVISASPHLRFSHGNTSLIYVRCGPPVKTGQHLSPLPRPRSSTHLSHPSHNHAFPVHLSCSGDEQH